MASITTDDLFELYRLRDKLKTGLTISNAEQKLLYRLLVDLLLQLDLDASADDED